jgi:hypothetical protein
LTPVVVETTGGLFFRIPIPTTSVVQSPIRRLNTRSAMLHFEHRNRTVHAGLGFRYATYNERPVLPCPVGVADGRRHRRFWLANDRRIRQHAAAAFASPRSYWVIAARM